MNYVLLMFVNQNHQFQNSYLLIQHSDKVILGFQMWGMYLPFDYNYKMKLRNLHIDIHIGYEYIHENYIQSQDKTNNA